MRCFRCNNSQTMSRDVRSCNYWPYTAANHCVEEHLLAQEHDDLRHARWMHERDGRDHGTSQVGRSIHCAEVVDVLLVWQRLQTQTNVYKDTSSLQTNVYKDTSSLQTSVYKDTSSLQTNVYKDTSSLQTNVYKDTSSLQTNVYKDTSSLQTGVCKGYKFSTDRCL